MNSVTRNTLIKVDRILTEAGWDAPGKNAEVLDDTEISRLRSAYKDLLAGDHLAILDRTLGRNQTLREAGEQMGLSEGAAAKLLREALAHLNTFAGMSSKA
jgi:DNA-directed RNA polymerase specialized sigma24 family protein